MSGLALVTGASGFVGSAVVRAALGAGHPVRALVRASSRRDNLDGLDVEIAEGDILDVESLERAMAGVRCLFHVAADYRLWARDPGEIVRTNVDGTRNVMEAAQRAGVERIVYTSSVATLAPTTNGTPADECRVLEEHAAIGAYKRSKVAAEQLVQLFVRRSRLPAVIVNPSTPIGPRDLKPTPTGRVILEAARGRIPAYVDTGLNLVHVDDVAQGHIAAMARGKTGERYILGGSNVLLANLLAEVAALVGRSAPRLRLPRRLMFPAAYAAEAIARVTGHEPLLTVDGLRMARYRMFFTSEKAQRELGYAPRPWLEGLREALDWFRQNGMLQP
jgi:dihydroflavonol-4-reductase